MLRGLALVSALAITSILSVDLATTAYASCASSYEDCEQMAVLVCHDRHLGDRDFIGGSNEGDADDIACVRPIELVTMPIDAAFAR
jgi:hypothetical protein